VGDTPSGQDTMDAIDDVRRIPIAPHRGRRAHGRRYPGIVRGASGADPGRAAPGRVRRADNPRTPARHTRRRHGLLGGPAWAATPHRRMLDSTRPDNSRRGRPVEHSRPTGRWTRCNDEHGCGARRARGVDQRDDVGKGDDVHPRRRPTKARQSAVPSTDVQDAVATTDELDSPATRFAFAVGASRAASCADCHHLLRVNRPTTVRLHLALCGSGKPRKVPLTRGYPGQVRVARQRAFLVLPTLWAPPTAVGTPCPGARHPSGRAPWAVIGSHSSFKTSPAQVGVIHLADTAGCAMGAFPKLRPEPMTRGDPDESCGF
jgi:hypothetical protein